MARHRPAPPSGGRPRAFRARVHPGERTIADYLTAHAEPEAQRAEAIARRHRAAVVVPACAESADFVSGLLPALGCDDLLVIVVNGRDDHPPAVHRDNARCLDDLVVWSRARRVDDRPPVWLGSLDGVALAVMDRASAGHRLPPRQGVGLARKIGLDFALALRAGGKLESRWLRTTDADAALPGDYLSLSEGLEAAAVVYPFRHLRSGDGALDRAHAIYELRLRHYVAGLRYARSPYAYHAVGSTMAIDADRYAAARGVPRRAAGEDFHLLAKLRKLGPIVGAPTAPIGLRARRSDRAPFGTGPTVARLLRDEHLPLFEHPEAFGLLRGWLATLACHAAAPVDSPRAAAVARESAQPEVLDRVLAGLDVDAGLARALRGTPASRRLARIHEWFDALRTLRFVHAARDAGLADLAWREALARGDHGALPLDDPFACADLLAAREDEGSPGVA